MYPHILDICYIHFLPDNGDNRFILYVGKFSFQQHGVTFQRTVFFTVTLGVNIDVPKSVIAYIQMFQRHVMYYETCQHTVLLIMGSEQYRNES